MMAQNLNDVVHDFGFLVVKNKGAHVGRGGRDVALEDAVKTVDIDWNNKAAVALDDPVYTMGLPGTWSAELRYAKGTLKQKQSLQFVYGCQLVEGSSGGPMPLNPLDEKPLLFSVNSFKSGYWQGDKFIQTACGGPILHGNSFCALLQTAEEAEFGSAESVTDGGLIHPYEVDKGCILPGWCDSDSDCDDGLFCNGQEKCVDNHCTAGTDPCNGLRCDKEIQQCLPPCTNNTVCDDGIFCNGVETCVEGKCVAGAGNPCSGDEMCDPMTDQCAFAECVSSADCDPGTSKHDESTDAYPLEVEGSSLTKLSSHCSGGLYCQGKGICMEGKCHVVETCEPDERCDEVSRSCALATCWLLVEQDFCMDDDGNDCCLCLDYCGPQEKAVVECAPMLFYPFPWGLDGWSSTYEEEIEPLDLRLYNDTEAAPLRIVNGTRYLQSNETGYLQSNETGYLQSNETVPTVTKTIKVVPTCLMWTLYMDGIPKEKPKTVLG